jgi:hypothetical protein
LRWGELAGLRSRNLDIDGRTVRAVETIYELIRQLDWHMRSTG